jgi:carbon-monoxide dehydrogenase small subunit
MTALSLSVNGRLVSAEVEPRTHLADFLRDHLLLTGTHTGCEHGVCGACTILIDGAPARSCIHFAAGCDGADVRTIEGLGEDAVTARLRHAFSAEHALQCGYCTPGMLVTARDIVHRLPDADDDLIRLELAGNLCRCTGYNGIVRAIRRVLDERLDIARPAPVPVPVANFGRVHSAGIAQTAPVSEGLDQRLAFQQPAERVWEALHDPALIAACVTGAQLDAATPDSIQGTMLVALGPVRARFGGTASITYDEASRSGAVQGIGQDQASGTRLNASARFQVIADGDAACVLVVTVEYGLRGALAQLARGRVVDLLAGEVAAMFARNLAVRLAGGTVTTAGPLSGGRLVLRAVLAWVRQVIRLDKG